MIKYEDVKEQTTEDYFNGNQFSIDVFNKKYRIDDKESYVQAVKRVCDFVASVEETPELQKYWSERWFDEIYDDWWHPAGSIMQGAGSGRNISLANCNTISLGEGRFDEEWDSLEGIIRNTAYTVSKTAAYRQGSGIDFTRLRPNGSNVKNSANISTGSTHWMQFIDNIANYVGQHGRIPALLFSLSCKHPDIIDFVNLKKDKYKVQNANISVQCTNDFYEAVKNNLDWELRFEIPEIKKGEKVYIDINSRDESCIFDEEKRKWYYIAKRNRQSEVITKTVKANELLELIAKRMSDSAEPGIQNIDIARKYSNSDYVYDEKDEYDSRIVSTNGCSEQYLSKDSLCILSSLNMGRFSTIYQDYIIELEKIGESINRFLDNVNECELRHHTYATPGQKLAIEKLRRTGAGLTNMGAWLLNAGYEYGTDDCCSAVALFMRTYNFFLYKSSIDLGKEKGSFGLFNKEKFKRSPFVQRLIEDFGLSFDSMRNVTCSSIAPTGTLTLMFRDMAMSYGIEPGFGLYFWKRTRMSGEYEYYFCVPRMVRDLYEQKGHKIPIDSDVIKDEWNGETGKKIVRFIDEHKQDVNIKFKSAVEINPLDKLELMSAIMKWVDSSISTTYLLPDNSNWKDVYDFILAANEKEIKSISAFPDKKMYGIVSQIPFKELATKLINEGVTIHEQNFSEDERKQLKYAKEEHISKTVAPKRPKELPCHIHHIKITKKLDKLRTFDYVVFVGLLNENEPYEIFVMENGTLDKKYKTGYIVKKTRGKYNVELEDFTIEDITKDVTDNEDVLTRMVSTSLRHGVSIKFLVQQLEKSQGDLYAFSRAISRILKHYIKDGENITGEVCPECGGTELKRQDGCKVCQSCGYSACG